MTVALQPVAADARLAIIPLPPSYKHKLKIDVLDRIKMTLKQIVSFDVLKHWIAFIWYNGDLVQLVFAAVGDILQSIWTKIQKAKFIISKQTLKNYNTIIL